MQKKSSLENMNTNNNFYSNLNKESPNIINGTIGFRSNYEIHKSHDKHHNREDYIVENIIDSN